MNTSRKDFIRIAGTAAGGMLLLPKFLRAIPAHYYPGLMDKKQTLVVVQLNGGNDGLNTFIPYQDPLYYQLRKAIGIPEAQVIKAAEGGMGFHPSMKGFAELMQKGHLSVIQNVGYPMPNRSHFRSQEIWQTGGASNQYLNEGWLGRYLDLNAKAEINPGALNLDAIDALSLKGKNTHAITLLDPSRFEQQLKRLKNSPNTQSTGNAQIDFVRNLMMESVEGSKEIQTALDKTATNQPTYPSTALARNLQWIARMIKGELATPVYYTSLGGFDTHAGQLNKHKQLLGELSESLHAFNTDMHTSGIADEVTVLVFSEFGRRVKDNGSGTDHGTAAPVFVLSTGNKKHIVGENPNLHDLDNGDLKYRIDFRSVYSSLLQHLFQFDAAQIGISAAPVQGLF